MSFATSSVIVSYWVKVGSGARCNDKGGSEAGDGKFEADNELTVSGEIAIAVDGDVYILFIYSFTISSLSLASCTLSTVTTTWPSCVKVLTFTTYYFKVSWLSSACFS